MYKELYLKLYEKYRGALSRVLKTKDHNGIKEEVPDFIVTDPFGYKSKGIKKNLTNIYDISYPKPFFYYKYGFDIIMKKLGSLNTDKIIPLIIENHTKNLSDNQFKKIEMIIKYIKRKYGDVEFVTLDDVNNNREDMYVCFQNNELDNSLLLNQKMCIL